MFLRRPRRTPALGRPWCDACLTRRCDACTSVGCFHAADGTHRLTRYAQQPHGNATGPARWDGDG